MIMTLDDETGLIDLFVEKSIRPASEQIPLEERKLYVYQEHVAYARGGGPFENKSQIILYFSMR